MGDQLDRAMALVRHDLEVAGAPAPVVEDSDWQTWPGAESAYVVSADGSGMGVWVDTTLSGAEQVAMLADQAQEWVVEWVLDLAGRRMTSWPTCPEHPQNHPMEAVAVGDAAWWVCPTSRRQIDEVGRLPSAE